MKNIFFSVLFLFSFIATIGQSIENTPNYAYLEGNLYTNKFLSFSVEVPENWIIQNEEQLIELKKIGVDLVVGENEKLKNLLNNTNGVYNLLTVFQYEVGSPIDDFNTNFALIAEDVSYAPGIKTGSDYLFHAKKLLLQTSLNIVQIDDAASKIEIGGIEFYKMHIEISMFDNMIKQDYYSTIMKGYSLGIIVSYQDDYQKQLVDKIINSFKFNL